MLPTNYKQYFDWTAVVHLILTSIIASFIWAIGISNALRHMFNNSFMYVCVFPYILANKFSDFQQPPLGFSVLPTDLPYLFLSDFGRRCFPQNIPDFRKLAR